MIRRATEEGYSSKARSQLSEDSGPPIVTVVMPVHNASSYVREAIQSIQKQSVRSIEIILVDDASTDGSTHILQNAAKNDERIQLVVNEHNKGNYPSRNIGLAMAKGEFVAVMDSDDIAYPQRLERQVSFLRENPEHVLVGSQVLLIDPEGAPIGLKGGLHTQHAAIDAALIERQWAVVHPAVTIRKSALDEIGGYREEFRTCADHDLYLRLAEIGLLANLPEVLLRYRQHYASLTRLQSDQQHNLHVIQREARERRDLPPIKDVDVPTIEAPTELERRQKMRLRYTWAMLALQEGYWTSALKNIGWSFLLDPLGATRTVAGRVQRKFSHS